MKRIAIIGLGQIGLVHLVAWLAIREKFPGWGLAICSSKPEIRGGNLKGGRRNNLGVTVPDQLDMTEVKAYETVEQLLEDPEVQLVIIAAPTRLHKQLVLKALAARKHVMVEKPLAFTAQDAREMLKAATTAQRYLFCAQILPWFADFRWLFDVKTKEPHRFGKLKQLHLFRHILTTDHTALPENALEFGGPWIDLASHDYHFLHALCKMPSHVIANGQLIGDFLRAVQATFFFADSDLIVTVDCGATLTGDAGFEHGFRAQFEQATAIYGSNGPGLTIRHGDKAISEPGMPSGDALSAFCGQLNHAIALVDNQVRDIGPLAAASAAASVQLCHSVREAVLSKRVVEISA